MATYETVVYERVEEKIFRLTLNRPEKLNALSLKLLSEFDQVLNEFEADRDASVLIIRGAGRAFCAGYDLQGTQQPGSGFTVSSDRINLHKIIDRWQRLWAIGKPTIAQVHGYCLAGATELAGHCDLVFASEDAQFGHPAGRSLGILPTLSMWPVLIGPRKAKEFFFTGDLMNAQEALASQLVNRVYPKDQLDAETLGLRASRRPGADRTPRVAQGRRQPLARYPGNSRPRTVGGRPRLYRSSDRRREELDEGQPRTRPERGAERARPSLRRQEVGAGAAPSNVGSSDPLRCYDVRERFTPLLPAKKQVSPRRFRA